MNLKSKIKSYNFWVSLGSAVLLLLNLLGRQFNFSIDECLYNDILTAICGILVILGIITMPAGTTNKNPITNQNESLNKNNKIIEQEQNEVIDEKPTKAENSTHVENPNENLKTESEQSLTQNIDLNPVNIQTATTEISENTQTVPVEFAETIQTPTITEPQQTEQNFCDNNYQANSENFNANQNSSFTQNF